MSNSKNEVVLSSVEGFNINNIIFSDCMEMKIPGSKLGYKQINISVQHEDGSIGDLILPTPKVYSYGVQESKDQGNEEKINGYQLPLCLWNKNGPTQEEKAFTDLFDQICEHAKKHLVEVRKTIGKKDLEIRDLKKFNPIYWKKDDDDNILPGTGPTFYAKLITKKNTDKKDEKSDKLKIMTLFTNEQGEIIKDPFSLLQKRCYAEAAIKFESIYIGAKISLRVKVYNAEVNVIESTIKPLLSSRRGGPAKMIPSANKQTLPSTFKEDDAEATGSLPNSDTEDLAPQNILSAKTEEAAPATTLVKKTITKVKLPKK
jgi:hypothetical protein